LIALPNINQSVGVYVVEWETELRSRIEDSGEGNLTIAMPSDGHAERVPPRGAAVYLDWICDRGVVRVRGIVSEFLRIPVPALIVIVDGAPEIHQRRNYVRASTNLTVLATPERPASADDGELSEIKGTTFDMSGGGMRIRLQGFDAEVDDRLKFEITMPDESIVHAAGKITRRPLPDVYCVEFEEIDKRAQERVVRLVFERLRSLAGRAA
jgi:c-di-GMP-binding flagellar brake protein YcgR